MAKERELIAERQWSQIPRINETIQLKGASFFVERVIWTEDEKGQLVELQMGTL